MSFHPDLGQERSEGFPSRTRSGIVETTAEKGEGGAKAARRELNELQNPRGFARSLSPPPSEHVASVPTSCSGPPGQAVGRGVWGTLLVFQREKASAVSGSQSGVVTDDAVALRNMNSDWPEKPRLIGTSRL